MVVKDRESARATKRFKDLNGPQLAMVQTLEKKLGCCVVALEPQPTVADLTSAQLNELKSLEKEMKAVLVAYACRP